MHRILLGQEDSRTRPLSLLAEDSGRSVAQTAVHDGIRHEHDGVPRIARAQPEVQILSTVGEVLPHAAQLQPRVPRQ